MESKVLVTILLPLAPIGVSLQFAYGVLGFEIWNSENVITFAVDLRNLE